MSHPGPTAVLALALLAASCGGAGSREEPAPQPAPAPAEAPVPVAPEPPRFVFTDVAAEAGLAGFRRHDGSADKEYIPETVGGGAAWLDHDGDGDLDLYLTNGGDLGPVAGERPRDALYENLGGGRFREVTEQAGLGDPHWTNGVTVADVNADGRPDLYLANFGPNALLINRGGRFEEATERFGVQDERWSTGAAFFDADGDGDTDLFVANYLDFDPHHVPEDLPVREYRGVEVMYGPRGLEVTPDAFFRREAPERFVDRTTEAGVRDEHGYGFQVLPFDHDLDGDLDVLVANDSTPNHLWSNDGTGRFRDEGLRSGLAVNAAGLEQASMGMTLGDADGDLRLDLFVTNFSDDYYTFYRNAGGGLYLDETASAGLMERTHALLGWSCAFFDADLDGDLDLFIANGHVFPQVDSLNVAGGYRQPNQLFENLGEGRFREVTASAGPGFAVRKSSRGAAVADYDDDGDLDVVINELDDSPTLLRNDSPRRGRWLKARVVGGPGDPDAVGSIVTLRTPDGVSRVRPVLRSTGYLSGDDPRLHFGVGEAETYDWLEVRWPGGARERFPGGPVERLVELRRGAGEPVEESGP